MSPRLRPLTWALIAAILFGTFSPALVYAQRSGGWGRTNNATQQKINALPQTADADVTIPILFGVEVSDLTPNFGDPRSGGRTHEGLDILAPRGTPIVSPTEAVVMRTGTGSSAGTYVYTANPGGETFVYMHLDAIADGVTNGVELLRGDIIGYVGNTGNAIGGPTHLHFELRKSGAPTDPFPRLTKAFTQDERLTYITNILSRVSNAADLSVRLVTNFRSTFVAMQDAGMTLSADIASALTSVPPDATPSGVAKTLPEGDLDIGSSGVAVVDLQKFLIAQETGPATTRLAGAGATGYFGTITQAALIEYQRAQGIEPATGYFGPVTRDYIASAVIHMEGSVEDEIFADDTTEVPVFTRDLTRGSTGEDVKALQAFLNQNGFAVAPPGEPGSVGLETAYFGPATERALAQFQAANNISPSVGYFGPLTRGFINS